MTVRPRPLDERLDSMGNFFQKVRGDEHEGDSRYGNCNSYGDTVIVVIPGDNDDGVGQLRILPFLLRSRTALVMRLVDC